MKIVKVIEMIAASEKSFEDAIQNCLNEVSKTIRNIDSIYVSEMKVHVRENKITTFGVNCKVSFRVEEGEGVV